jgi:hypothetical protein
MSDGFPDIPPGGCGNWSTFDVPTIWSMLAYEDGVLSVEQATAWNRTYDLLASHAKNLQTLRDGLAERWPPERNEASAVFLEYLDKLIGSVNPASFASSSNAVVLSDLIDTLADARSRVAPLHEQWEAAGGSADPKLQGELNTRAAEIMASTDVAVYQHGQRFVLPPDYQPPAYPIDTTSPFTPSNSSLTPTRVRPLSPTSRRPTASTTTRITDETSARATIAGLSGGPSTRLPSSPARSGASAFINTPADHALPPGGVIGLPPGRTVGPRGPRWTAVPSNPRPSERLDTLAPGSPKAGEGAPDEVGPRRGTYAATNPATTEPRNPVGGLIGGAAGNQTRRHSYSQGESYVRWTVRGGVPAVLQPSADKEDHDPGPGVFGIDR